MWRDGSHKTRNWVLRWTDVGLDGDMDGDGDMCIRGVNTEVTADRGNEKKTCCAYPT